MEKRVVCWNRAVRVDPKEFAGKRRQTLYGIAAIPPVTRRKVESTISSELEISSVVASAGTTAVEGKLNEHGFTSGLRDIGTGRAGFDPDNAVMTRVVLHVEDVDETIAGELRVENESPQSGGAMALRVSAAI